jgi:hypothetical protein
MFPDDIEFRHSDNQQIIPDKQLTEFFKKLFPWKVIDNEEDIKRICNNLCNYERINSITRNIQRKDIKLGVPLDANLEIFRSKLKQNATEGLCEKLHHQGVKDYRKLGIEIGSINRDGNALNRNFSHSRKWDIFDYDSLKKQDQIFILSSETGSGKTTFLRKLQTELIDETDKLPLYFDADALEKIDFKSRNEYNFLKSISYFYNGYFEDGHEYEFLKQHYNRIIFLFDGLDQTQCVGTGFKNLLRNIYNIVSRNLIIASRPYAVVSEENNRSVDFLRLKYFTNDDLLEYFGDMYTKAMRISESCGKIISVPVLAYMIRCLIENGKDVKITHRSQLYHQFIDYLIMEYDHENISVSFGKRAWIRKCIGKLSYESIAAKTHFMQQVPLSKAIQYLPMGVEIDDLLKFGLLHIVINRSHGIEDLLYFSHQSFQEYLAAEYACKDEVLVDKILAEKWNPKWKEVIKFMAGIKGQELFEKIFNQKDNIIYSNLFLCSQLTAETECIDNGLRDIITKKLEYLVYNQEFALDAIQHLYSFNKTKINGIVKDMLIGRNFQDWESRIKAIHFISRLNGLDCKVMLLIIYYWGHNQDFDKYVLDCGASFMDHIDPKALKYLFERINNNEPKSLLLLEKIEIKLDDDQIRILVEKIAEPSLYSMVPVIINTLIFQKDNIDDNNLYAISYKLHHEYPWVRMSVLKVLYGMCKRLEDGIIKVITELLMDPCQVVRDWSILILHDLHLLDKNMVEDIIDGIDSEDIEILRHSLVVLGGLHLYAKNDVVDKIISKIEVPELYEEALDTLERLGGNLADNQFDQIINKLNIQDSEIRLYIIITLESIIEGRLNSIDKNTIKSLILYLDDECIAIRFVTTRILIQFKDQLEEMTIKKMLTITVDSILEVDEVDEEDEEDEGEGEGEDYDSFFDCIIILNELYDYVDRETITRLVEALDNTRFDNISILKAIATLAQKINDNSVVICKVVGLLDDSNNELSLCVLDTLETIKDSLTKKNIAIVIDKLKDREIPVQLRALEVIWNSQIDFDLSIIKQFGLFNNLADLPIYHKKKLYEMNMLPLTS